MDILVTNNPLVKEQCCDKIKIEFFEAPLIGILTRVRGYVHSGYRLLTHPLSGNVKPNETPYKSVLITEALGEVDEQSVRIIEECMSAAHKFPPGHIHESYLSDLQTVDLSLITPTLEQY